jgi:hypothetical protein
MKYIFTLAITLIACCVNAQTIIFQEHFDEMTSYSITGWPYQFSGAVPWQCGQPFWVGPCMLPLGAAMSENGTLNKVACFCECGAFNYNDSSVLTYTPAINLSTDTGVWLKYDSYFIAYTNGMGDTERATVEISTDDGDTWTVVEEVAPSVPIGLFNTHYINLHAYNNAPNIRIGFRYNDDGGHMMGWAIDNVVVFTPAHHDIAISSVTPADTMLSYLVVGGAHLHRLNIFNAGLDTIHSFTLNYNQDGGATHSYTFSGLNIPAFSNYSCSYPTPDTVFTTGRHMVRFWASLDGDNNIHNDSGITALTAVGFMPPKRLAIESGEGTYNGWSVRNMYYLQSVTGLDIPASLISVHEADPMMDTVYHDYLFYPHWNYVPYILFDRRFKVPLDSFYYYIDIQKNYFGFANMQLSSSCDGHAIAVSATVTPAVDLHGDYRLSLVLTEDGVSGSDAGYEQHNNYAGGVLGPMGGYELLPAVIPATQMVYNYVARRAAPSPDGDAGLLPADMDAGTPYTATIVTAVNHLWDLGKLKAKVLLIRHDDSVILNSAEIRSPVAITNVNTSVVPAVLYPNPAADDCRVRFSLLQQEEVALTITDMQGMTVYTSAPAVYGYGTGEMAIPTAQMANGIYLATLNAAGKHTTLKLEVMH